LTAERTLRIGNGAGFWGDNLDVPELLVRTGDLDVLTLEYLAELTLAILSHLRSRDADSGFIPDFPELVPRLVPCLRDQPALKIVTNAGGLNPLACARGCARKLVQAGLGETVLGVVTGDDLLERIPGWIADQVDLAHMETGEPISTVADRLVSANVYLGAEPIARVLNDEARIALTGRVADASLTLGPALSHFGWAWDDWDRLAGASAAGHVIECGAQATGGLWHRWDAIPDLANVGYPIAEVDHNGQSVITKPEGSGGLVTPGTVAEQIVYEIDDPTCYRTPDVDVDLTGIRLNDEGANRVALRGARGRPPGTRLKVAAVYRNGWTASGMLAVVGQGAAAKAKAAGALLLQRVRRAGFTLAETLVECLGAGEVVPGLLRPQAPPLEVMLRVSVRDENRKAVERFCREFAPLVTSGPSGIAGYATGRPSARPAFGYWPTLVDRTLIEARTRVATAEEWSREIA